MTPGFRSPRLGKPVDLPAVKKSRGRCESLPCAARRQAPGCYSPIGLIPVKTQDLQAHVEMATTRRSADKLNLLEKKECGKTQDPAFPFSACH
jgi:hypothetical protein